MMVRKSLELELDQWNGKIFWDSQGPQFKWLKKQRLDAYKVKTCICALKSAWPSVAVTRRETK